VNAANAAHAAHTVAVAAAPLPPAPVPAAPPAAIPPPWVNNAGHITLNSLKDDLMNYLALRGGGRYRNFLIAPNNFTQYGNLLVRLRDTATDGWWQANGIDQQFLLFGHYILDCRKKTTALPILLQAPPAPLKHYFSVILFQMKLSFIW